MANIAKTSGSLFKPFFSDFFDVDDFFKRSGGEMMTFKFPAVNISETEKDFVVEMAVPGFKKEDFKIKVENEVLTIEAEKKEEKVEEEKNYTRKEYSHESFCRSFKLPENVKEDMIMAGYEDGMLKLTLPKTNLEVKAKKEIKVS
jgi:HSP20 family protein